MARLTDLLTRTWFYSYTGTLYAGVAILLVSTVYPSLLLARPNKISSTSFAQPSIVPPSEITVISGKPSRIVIPRLGINLEILDGNYDPNTGEWTLSENRAYFATLSQYANDYRGNTFIYGHNNKLVFSKLDRLVPGDTMQIITKNGHTFSYIFASGNVVPPNDLGILSYSGPPIVTVQTCSGSWYQNRSMFTFNLDEVDG